MQTVLFVVAGAAFVGAFVFRSMKPDKIGPPWALFGVGALLVVGALVVPRIGGGPGATVSFVSPADGATVPANEPVAVEVELQGGEIATSASDAGGHLHIYANDTVISMPSSTVTEIELEPGRYELKVEYVDVGHASFDPPVEATIDVVARKTKA